MNRLPIFILFACLPFWVGAQTVTNLQLTHTLTVLDFTTVIPLVHSLKPIQHDIRTQPPAFPGGPKGLSQYVMENLYLPVAAIDNQVEDNILVQFTISPKGSIQDYEVLQGLPFHTAAVVDLLRQMPAWQPATRLGVPVSSKFQLPIHLTY